ncbi:MAG TPA: sulfate ABC transporter substrate-binding protein [Nocardioides sp.]|nr:sulfate ABC transporter substrate-binding protein [Nocardioides sp.]
MTKTIKAAAVGLAGVLALSACTSTGASGDDGNTISVVAFSVMETANEPVFEAFQDTGDGKDAEFAPSYGASGDQSRAVVSGAEADVVHFSLETDVTRLVDEGLVADDWKDNATKGIATSSVVVFVVRKGNPENIQTWDDLVKPGVEIVTPNPGSSGSARWNILGAWAHVVGNGGTDAEAEKFVSDLLGNTPALPASGREATSAFVEGDQDVLLSYENEAILAKQNGEDIDYILPEDTLLIENPAAVTEDAGDGAQEFLDFMTSAEGQGLYAGFGFRPVVGVDGVEVPEVEGANDPADPFPAPAQLFTLDGDFGGWGEAADKYFADGEDGGPVGIIPRLIEESGTDAQE